MLLTIIGIFLLTALFGAYLFSYIWMDKNTPKGIAFLHGFFGVIGITLLGIYSFFNPLGWISFGILILAALGGLFILSLDLLDKKIPKIIPIIHGFVAFMGVLFLISLALKNI
jgi:hypothetical protein